MSKERKDTPETAADEVYELEPEEGLDADDLVNEAVEAAENDEVRAAEEPDLEAELEELRERYLRTMADFENFRKRVERERREAARFAAAEPLRDFLSVVDNLDRALAAEGSPDDLKAGVELILRQMKELLRRFEVEPVPAAKGDRFDPTVHEAVLRFEDPEVSEQVVTEELQKGYLLHDRLLRPAMVKVAVPAEDATEPASGDS